MLAFPIGQSGVQMDREGRFDFWGMLLHTRAITPPTGIRSGWVLVAWQRLPAWVALPVIVGLVVGIALHASHPTPGPVVVSQPKAISVAVPLQPSRPW
jgi:hypothetical protein